MDEQADRTAAAAEALQIRNLRRIHSGLAHDLRSPFNAAFLQLELLKLTVAQAAGDPGTPRGRSGADRQVARLEQLESELQRLRGAIEALVSQFEADASRRTFDLSAVVREIGELTSSQASKEGVQVVVRTAAPLSVSARLDLVRASVFGLVLRALDRAAGRGTLSLEMSQADQNAQLVVSATVGGDVPNPTSSPADVARLDVLWEIVRSQGASLDLEAEDSSFVWRLRMPLAPSD